MRHYNYIQIIRSAKGINSHWNEERTKEALHIQIVYCIRSAEGINSHWNEAYPATIVCHCVHSNLQCMEMNL